MKSPADLGCEMDGVSLSVDLSRGQRNRMDTKFGARHQLPAGLPQACGAADGLDKIGRPCHRLPLLIFSACSRPLLQQRGIIKVIWALEIGEGWLLKLVKKRRKNLN